MLWGRSANRCAMPECRRTLVEDETETDDPSIVGDEAHIVAREEDGPRGHSDLSPEQRDKFDNLVLMCKIHHKVIDDQPKEYTVERLHQIKQDHLDWIDANLNPDKDKQKDEEIYATYVDKVADMADFENWKNWTSDIFGNGQPQIPVERFDKLASLNEYLLSRTWPKRYDKLERAFINFRVVLNDFLTVFSKYREKIGTDDYPIYNTEKIYKRLSNYDESAYQRLSDKFDFHVDLVQDLGCELTRSANYLCDQIRKYLSSSFRMEEGVLLIITGPDMSFKYTTIRLEFASNKFDEIKYPGLKQFMETRHERGHHFGKGVSPDYLPMKFE